MEKTVLVMSRRSPRLQQWALEERASRFVFPRPVCPWQALGACSSSIEGQELRRGPALSPGSWRSSAVSISLSVCCRNPLLPLSSQLFLRHLWQ